MGLQDIIQPLSVAEVDNLPDINYHNIKKAALVLKAIDHSLRHQLVKTIHENKTITVTQLYTSLGIEQSVASQHLAILRKAGIISANRNGKFIFYTLNKARIDEINHLVKSMFD